jgi:hypothetical protein
MRDDSEEAISITKRTFTLVLPEAMDTRKRLKEHPPLFLTTSSTPSSLFFPCQKGSLISTTDATAHTFFPRSRCHTAATHVQSSFTFAKSSPTYKTHGILHFPFPLSFTRSK